MSTKTTAIVTGASGFIGGRFAFLLASNNYTVIAPMRNKSQALISHINIKLTTYSELLTSFNKANVDEIVHCAALTVANSKDEVLIHQVNLTLANIVVKWIYHYEPKFVAFMSTTSVYGEVKGDILSYHTSIDSPCPYGDSKLISEGLIRNACINNRSSFCILRLPGTVGYGSHSNIISRLIQKMMIKNIPNNMPLALSNPDALFNNILPVVTLMEYYTHLSKIAQSEYISINTLLASSSPIKFKIAVDYLSSLFNMRTDDVVLWQSNLTHSFTIDVVHSISNRFKPLTTLDALSIIASDIQAHS